MPIPQESFRKTDCEIRCVAAYHRQRTFLYGSVKDFCAVGNSTQVSGKLA